MNLTANLGDFLLLCTNLTYLMISISLACWPPSSLTRYLCAWYGRPKSASRTLTSWSPCAWHWGDVVQDRSWRGTVAYPIYLSLFIIMGNIELLNNFNISFNISCSFLFSISAKTIWNACDGVSKVLGILNPWQWITIQLHRCWSEGQRSPWENYPFVLLFDGSGAVLKAMLCSWTH